MVPAHSTALHESIGLLHSMVCREQNIFSLMDMKRQGLGETLYTISVYREDSHRSYSGPTSVKSLLLVMCEVCATQQRNLCFVFN